jgi:hypothetical protein
MILMRASPSRSRFPKVHTYTLLYYTVLYYTIPHYTTLYYAYRTILYYTILHVYDHSTCYTYISLGEEGESPAAEEEEEEDDDEKGIV